MTELDDGLLGTEVHLLAQREQLADHLLRRMEIPLVHNLVNQFIHGWKLFSGRIYQKRVENKQCLTYVNVFTAPFLYF